MPDQPELLRPASADRFCRGSVKLLRRFGAWTLDLLLPGLCPLCGAACANLSQSCLCNDCISFWEDPLARCRSCAIQLDDCVGHLARPELGLEHDAEASLCRICRILPPSFDATVALACYGAPLDRLALDLKFHRRVAMASEFARRIAIAVRSRKMETIDLIVPIPLSRQRLAQRGYNQAWQIARPLGRHLAVAADARCLRRVIDTPPQSGLDLAERTRNLHRAFAVVTPLVNRHVAVVDDVMTSGSTLEAAAQVLKQAGARRVTNLVVFRTPAPRS